MLSPLFIFTVVILTLNEMKGKNLIPLGAGSAWQSRKKQNSKIKMQNDKAKLKSEVFLILFGI